MTPIPTGSTTLRSLIQTCESVQTTSTPVTSAAGVTTVLTMTFLGLEARTDLPKVPYTTALDLFLWLSYGFIFATIIEASEAGI